MELTKELLEKILIDCVDCDYCKFKEYCGEGYNKCCFELDEKKLPKIMQKLEKECK